MNTKKSIFNKLLYFINTLFALLLLLAYLLPYVEPVVLKSFSGISLFTPLLIIINILFVVYWLLNMRRVALLSLVILVVGFANISKFYKFTGKRVLLADDIKIMSYNVRMFNKYNWIKTDSIASKIDAFITQKAPDVICFQEYTPNMDVADDYQYKYEIFSNKSENFGHAIFSKYPIVNKGKLPLEKTNNAIFFVDLKIDTDTIRVYNLHLQSIGINPNREITEKAVAERIRNRIGAAFQKQQKQVEVLLAHQKKTNHRIVLAGDFNNTAFSWPYRSLTENKNDAFVMAGRGFDKTFDFSFPMRIDFILVDESVTVNHFKTYYKPFSDHYPILARLARKSLLKKTNKD